MIIKVVIDTNDEKWKFNKTQQRNKNSKSFSKWFRILSFFPLFRCTIQQFKVWKSKYNKKDIASRKVCNLTAWEGERQRQRKRRRKKRSPRKDLRRQFADYCKASCLVFTVCEANKLWQLFFLFLFFFKLLREIHQMWIDARARRFKGTRDCLRCSRRSFPFKFIIF